MKNFIHTLSSSFFVRAIKIFLLIILSFPQISVGLELIEEEVTLNKLTRSVLSLRFAKNPEDDFDIYLLGNWTVYSKVNNSALEIEVASGEIKLNEDAIKIAASSDSVTIHSMIKVPDIIPQGFKVKTPDEAEQVEKLLLDLLGYRDHHMYPIVGLEFHAVHSAEDPYGDPTLQQVKVKKLNKVIDYTK